MLEELLQQYTDLKKIAKTDASVVPDMRKIEKEIGDMMTDLRKEATVEYQKFYKNSSIV